jgi:hypothetical protein
MALHSSERRVDVHCSLCRPIYGAVVVFVNASHSHYQPDTFLISNMVYEELLLLLVSSGAAAAAAFTSLFMRTRR